MRFCSMAGTLHDTDPRRPTAIVILRGNVFLLPCVPCVQRFLCDRLGFLRALCGYALLCDPLCPLWSSLWEASAIFAVEPPVVVYDSYLSSLTPSPKIKIPHGNDAPGLFSSPQPVLARRRNHPIRDCAGCCRSSYLVLLPRPLGSAATRWQTCCHRPDRG